MFHLLLALIYNAKRQWRWRVSRCRWAAYGVNAVWVMNQRQNGIWSAVFQFQWNLVCKFASRICWPGVPPKFKISLPDPSRSGPGTRFFRRPEGRDGSCPEKRGVWDPRLNISKGYLKTWGRGPKTSNGTDSWTKLSFMSQKSYCSQVHIFHLTRY